MAWRFKVSKYKNATPVLPKKEDWISDIKVGAPSSCGNHIKASAAFIAFNIENRGGGSLGVLPIDYKGRLDTSAPLLHGHSDLITDFDFSPFDDGMLATCSTDANVKIWHIPEGGLKEHLTEAEYSLPQFDKRVENVNFHPTTDYLLTIGYFDTVKLWDLRREQEVYCFNQHEDQVQSTSWRANGTLVASTAKDKKIRIIDPRSKSVAYEADNHKAPRESRVVWLGDTDSILSTGFDAFRTRELRMRDLRNFGKPFKVQTFDSSTGTLIPLFDADTNMLFLAGKADVTVMYWELTTKEPYLTEGLKHSGCLQTKGACTVPKRGLNVMAGEVNRVLQLTASAVIPIMYQVPRKTYREFHADIFPETAGFSPAATVPQWLDGCNLSVRKMSLDPGKHDGKNLHVHKGPLSKRKVADEIIMEPELPVPAPRSHISNGVNKENKTNLGFNKPTVAVKPSLIQAKSVAPKPAARSSFSTTDNKFFANVGVNNDNGHQPYKSLAQIKRAFESANQEPEENSEADNQMLANVKKNFELRSISLDERPRDKEDVRERSTVATIEETDGPAKTEKKCLPASERRRNYEQRLSVEEKQTSPSPRRAASTRSFRRVCKFRHLKGTPAHKSGHIDNLRDLNRTIPGECDGIAANAEFVILPLTGQSGKLSVIHHRVGGRLPDGVIPCFLNGTCVLDFSFDPFNPNVLAAACDDGRIRLWDIPDGGLKAPTNEPHTTMADSAEKITILKWHPLTSSVLASACGDLTIKIWDTGKQVVSIVLEGHSDQIFSMAWSPCGRFLSSVCRDGKLRIFDPRKSVSPTHEGVGPPGVRGARILWVLDGKFIIVCGFSKISERQVSIFKANDLSKPLNTVTIDVNPAILVPSYDSDTSTLFVTGKGDSTIYAYEVGDDSPHLFPLSHHKGSSVHQGFVLLPKRLCDVRHVEFCKALRLTQATLEPLSFTVPRVKTELFQDDLFPPTQVSWEHSMTAAEWFGGTNRLPRLVSLQPPDMLSVSEKRDGNSPSSVTFTGRLNSAPASRHFQPNEAQIKLEASMRKQIGDGAITSLEQDKVDGVDGTEWEE